MDIENLLIRDEEPADIPDITEVTVAAFETMAISSHTEQFIIQELRAANVLAISLVAEVDGRVVGHIAFSPVIISDGRPSWYGLGPVFVPPAYQRQGTGNALIEEGLSRLSGMNARGCCLVGHPEYYSPIGFIITPELVLANVPPEVFFGLSFDRRIPRGTVTFHDGIKADGQQGRAAEG